MYRNGHEPLVSVQTFETVQHQRRVPPLWPERDVLKISFRAWRFVWTCGKAMIHGRYAEKGFGRESGLRRIQAARHIGLL